MTDFLSCTERGGAQPVVTRYVGGWNRTVLSNPFGTLIGSDDPNIIQINTVLQTDNNTIFCVTYQGLWRSTDGGINFASVQTFSSVPAPDAGKISHSGIHLVYDPGTQQTFLAGYFLNIAGILFGWRYRLSDGATAEASSGFGPPSYSVVSEALYGNVIHLAYGSAASPGFYSFDPISLSWATYAHSPATAHGNAFAVAQDNLLYAVSYDNSSNVTLFRFTGTWNSVGSIQAVASDSGAAGSRFALFSDGTNLYAVYLYSNTGYGWRVKSIPPPFDLTGAGDIGPTVLPTVLRGGGDGGTADGNNTKRCVVIQDTESVPGTVRTFLMFSNDNVAGTPWQVYEWNGPSSAMSFVGIGGAVRDALPSASRGGGGYFFTPSQPGVRILSVTPVSGGESISFVASGGGTVDIQFRRSGAQQAPTAIATLIGTATGGGTRVGNQVQGVMADGVTVNTITWDFFTDGLVGGQANIVLVPETV